MSAWRRLHDVLDRYLPGKGLDLYVLLALLLLVGGTWSFVKLADAVIEGETQSFDEAILRGLRRADDPSVPIGPPWLEESMRDLTALGGATVLALVNVALIGYLAIARKFHAVVLILVAIGGGSLINPLLKDWFVRSRPSVVPHLVEVGSSSFPSGHSMGSTIVFLTLGTLLARLVPPLWAKLYVLGVAVLLSLLVGISRVYLGVHYPSDVLGGWAAGLAWAILCWLAVRWLQNRGVVERTAAPEPPEPNRT